MYHVIHMISSPRNVSTAMMYSFAQRRNYRVIDEPYYACYLERTGVPHPGFDEIVASQSADAEEVTEQLSQKAAKSNLFIKNMSHHMEDLPLRYVEGHQVLLLIRNPLRQIASFARVIEHPDMRDIGIGAQHRIFEALHKKKHPVTVLDAGRLLADPERSLRNMCKSLGIRFSRRMLSWEPGPRPQDGVWAEYWYDNVHRSTGFGPPSSGRAELPGHLTSLYREALPHYNFLLSHALN